MRRISNVTAMARVSITIAILCLLLLSLDANSAGPYEIDFSGIPPARTPKEAEEGFAARAQRVTDYNACRDVDQDGPHLPWSHIEADPVLNLDFTTVAIAKLEKGATCPGQVKDNVAQANDALLNARVKKRSGTSFQDVPGCRRSGDYDFALRGLVAIMHRYGPFGPEAHRDRLRPDVYAHVLHNLLNQRGPHDPNIEEVCFDFPCPLPCLPETENHILMIETSRYLTNQLLLKEGGDPDKYDNGKNKFNKWMLEHLQQFLQNDFDEYNSRPYQTYSILPIQNLYEFAEDPAVKKAAQIVLDYLSAKFAVSSNELRRAVPFRRRKENKNETHLFGDKSDPQTQRFIMLSGLTQRLDDVTPVPLNVEWKDRDLDTSVKSVNALDSIIVGPNVTLKGGANVTLRAGNRIVFNPGFRSEPGARLLAEIGNPSYFAFFGGRDLMQLAAVWTYRVPDLILDLVMDKTHNSYYQLIRHDGVELYWSSPEFLITGGGFWQPSRLGLDEFNCYADVGWTLPTTLMPTGGGVDYKDLIQIEGDRTRRCSIPHTPDFLCPCFKVDNARVNTCLAPGFACGINPIVPSNYNSCKSDPVGRWNFINAPLYNPAFEFYVAVYSKDVEPGQPAGWKFGFFEATSSKGLDFESFKSGVLSRNSSLDLKEFEPNDYVTVSGQRIRFVPGVPECGGDYQYCGDKYRWGIISTGDPALGCKDRSNIGTWPLAEGDIINSDGHSGLVIVDNPYLDKRLILDMRHHLNPERIPVEGVGRSDKEIWVDFHYSGSSECGTFESPYNTLAKGERALPWNGGTLKIKAGSRDEAITMTKTMRIEAYGGKVTIGR